VVGLITLLVGSFYFLWQFALTGDLFSNPYLLWWPYDRVGFGPGIGLAEEGHTLRRGWLHTKYSLLLTWQDLWGWGRYSWVLPLIGLWAGRRQPRVYWIASVFPSLVVAYLAYWVSGPRYFYEGLYSLTILGAAGIAWLGEWLPEQVRVPSFWTRVRVGVLLIALAGLVIFGSIPSVPERLYEIKDRYGFSQQELDPFRTPEAQAMTPALVILHAETWWEYGAYLNLQDPYLSSPFIFAWALPAEDPSDILASAYPDRMVYHYYVDRPGEFFSEHQP
jgi:hypothetical protein